MSNPQVSHPRKYRTEASASANDQEVVILISGAWKTYVTPDDLHDMSLLTRLKVEIALLRLHRKDTFCGSQDWNRSNGGRQSTVTSAVLPSLDVFFGNDSGPFSRVLVGGTDWPINSGLEVLSNAL